MVTGRHARAELEPDQSSKDFMRSRLFSGPVAHTPPSKRCAKGPCNSCKTPVYQHSTYIMEVQTRGQVKLHIRKPLVALCVGNCSSLVVMQSDDHSAQHTSESHHGSSDCRGPAGDLQRRQDCAHLG